MTGTSSDVAFAEAAVAAVLPPGALAPFPPFPLPPGYTPEAVAALLTRLVADEDRLRAYTDALVAIYKREGVWEHMLRTLPNDLPEETDIFARGFGHLPPDRLALIALDPYGIAALAGVLREDPDTRPGEWYGHALLAADGDGRDERTHTQPVYLVDALPTREDSESRFVLSDAVAPSPRVEPPTVLRGLETERPKGRFRAGRYNPFRLVSEYPRTAVACLLVGVGVQQGVAAAGDSAAISSKLNTAEGLRQARNLAEWDEGLRAFEQADGDADHASLFWEVFYTGDRRRLEALRKDYGHAKALRAELIEANRTWLTEDGIAAVNDRYVAAFTKLGLFPADRPPSAMVSEADQQRLVAFVKDRPAVRRSTLSAIDQWLSVLYVSKEKSTKWAASAKRLWDATLDLEQRDAERPALLRLRQLVGERDVNKLEELFLSPARATKDQEARFTPDELRRIPSSLFAQVFGLLNDSGRSDAAFRIAVRYSAVQPREAVVNGVLANAVATPVEQRQYSYALTVNDPENPLYQNWYGKALFDTGVIDEAVERFELAVKLSEEQGRPFALAHGNLATAYAALYRFDEAVREYEEAIREAAKPGQQSDEEVRFHYGLAKTLHDSGRDPARVIREAEWCADWFHRRQVIGDPGDLYVWSHVFAGLSYLALGRATDALPALSYAAERRPNTATIQLHLGKCHLALGNLPEAIKATERALVLDPKSVDANAALANLYLAAGDVGKLRGVGRKQEADFVEGEQKELAAYDANPNSEPTERVAEAAARVKRYATAGKALQKVLTADFKEQHAKHPDYPVDELVAREPLTLLAVGSLARAGRAGDADQPKDANDLNAAAVTWGKSLLRGLSARYERVRDGRGGDTRLDLLHAMDQYQTSGLLAPVREPAMLKALPAGEQQAWAEFWKGWNELHAKVRALPLDPETGRPSKLLDF